MNPVVSVRDLVKTYPSGNALDGVSFDLEPGAIYGFLGRNGAGKSTTMAILTSQLFATSGTVRVFGEDPYENPRVLGRMCFVRENQKYPESMTAAQALRAASLFYPGWDHDFAERLVADFRLPLKTKVKKLSRGQLSAVGVIIGLCSRAEITFFDEPYLGLDAVARQIFYDRLIADYAEHPRTILMSSHLIDEIANLIERVLVIDAGRIIMDETVEEATSAVTRALGPTAALDRLARGHRVLERRTMGSAGALVFHGIPSAAESETAAQSGVRLEPVGLQESIVHRTAAAATAAGPELTPSSMEGALS
ncbi:ABC transporter ATP-binding protein [Brevibacterium luteolum]|uniref:ABC transporter ATP-binding protein n=1 Tax=Brevibacterium luteolum TaxID=199591 RepID=A0A6G8KZK9_9MICO|nr:ABC transporter ATP-binding protein [Brevibacterium luteolum]QIN30238.1 ABC transporter ATP-binding protein [Brevibacterium luteolum]